MATAITADGMLAALDKWGIVPKFYRPDWRTHNRSVVSAWGPINGFVVHNFGSDTPDPNSLAYLYTGDAGRQLPGPLAQFAITDDGQVWVIGWGPANHTGYVEAGLHALVNRDAAPLDADYRPSTRQPSDGSIGQGIGRVAPHYIGVEMTYGKAPTDAQRVTVARLGAALMDMLGTGYTGGSVIGHRECTVDRQDPTGVPMWQLRREINALLKAGVAPAPQPAPTPKPQPTPAPEPPKETFLMALTDAQQAQLVDDIATIKRALPPGQALSRKAGDGSTPRILDSGDGYALITLARSIAAKVGVDESAIAAGVLEGLKPLVADAVTSAVAAGTPTADLADAVVARLGERLAPPA